MRSDQFCQKISMVFVTTATLVLGAWANVNAQGVGNTLTGFIYSEDRSPISDVAVEIYSYETEQFVARVRTTSSGQYRFYGLRGSSYRVRVMPLGTNFVEQSQTVDFFNTTRQLSNGQTLTSWDNKIVDFYLRQRGVEAVQKAKIVVAQDVPERAKAAFEKAVDDLNNKRFAEGLAEIQQALEIFPTYYLALRRLGIEYMRQDKPAEAVQAFIKAAHVYNNDPENWYGIGYASYKINEFPTAAAAFQRAFELDGKSIAAAVMLGKTLRILKQAKEAEKYLKKADSLANGGDAEVHHQLSLLYSNDLQEYAMAADELEKFLKLEPHSPDADRIRDLIKKLRAKAAEKKNS